MARVAFIVDQMFEDAEFRIPYDRVTDAGHEVDIVGKEAGAELVGKKEKERIRTEKAAAEVASADYDALVIPGGYSPDMVRTDPDMVRLTRDVFTQQKPVAAVCHAGWVLAEAGVLADRTVTSWPSIKTDLVNAGARWVDREVVEDGNLITSRNPGDLESFSAALLEQLDRGVAARVEPPRASDATSDEGPEKRPDL